MTTPIQTRLEALYGQERRRSKLGLEGTRALLAALGDPHLRFRSVHVAGTNGKGSVCALIERVLREAGYRTGLFTSPHLVDFRERIRVSGRWVEDAWLDRALTRIEGLPEGRDRTFFEVATALGFLWFAECQVEIAVIEVGLGGRLDTTNVITPEVSVITTIGFDHAEILGATLPQIAREKAGIIKPGVPVVLPKAKGEALSVIEAVALERGAPIAPHLPRPVFVPDSDDLDADDEDLEDLELDEDDVEPGAPEDPESPAREKPKDPVEDLGDGLSEEELELMRSLLAERERGITVERTPWGDDLSLPGRVPGPGQAWNREQALSALGVLQERGFSIPVEAIAAGFAHARWPGRFERCPSQPRLWWDAAHNPQGFRELGNAWWAAHREDDPLATTRELGPAAAMHAPVDPPAAVVLALSRDKDVESILTELRWAFRPLRLIATRSRNERSMDPESIGREAESQRIEATVAPDVVAAVRDALDSTGDEDVLLCGSIFAIGEAMESFGGAPGEWL